MFRACLKFHIYFILSSYKWNIICCYDFIDMVTVDTTSRVVFRTVGGASSQLKTMALPSTQTHCKMDGYQVLLMKMTKLMKALYTRKSHSSGKLWIIFFRKYSLSNFSWHCHMSSDFVWQRNPWIMNLCSISVKLQTFMYALRMYCIIAFQASIQVYTCINLDTTLLLFWCSLNLSWPVILSKQRYRSRYFQ